MPRCAQAGATQDSRLCARWCCHRTVQRSWREPTTLGSRMLRSLRRPQQEEGRSQPLHPARPGSPYNLSAEGRRGSEYPIMNMKGDHRA